MQPTGSRPNRTKYRASDARPCARLRVLVATILGASGASGESRSTSQYGYIGRLVRRKPANLIVERTRKATIVRYYYLHNT
ncbi:hypothetical protein BD311DRAFT_513756 [Dichomitus squalens]|uniref:Uncharacterized protein n=1 Tax=Dichomitus squalens TaxID=114155 RepID=A0A4Q9MYM6_9APHY|nr:hypothetical protein BD311DRAFT_513756 [Dichomitus squalens]